VVEVIERDGKLGYEEEAPYDGILVSAEADSLLDSWKEQLKVGGRIVVPIGSSITLFKKINEDEFHREEMEGFAFVPLV